MSSERSGFLGRSEVTLQIARIGQGDNDSSANMHEVGIGLGSNLGESIKILQSAWRQLRDHLEIFPLALSRPYRSQPVGMISTKWFINAAGIVRTTLPPLDLLQVFQLIETRCGRLRPVPTTSRYQDRTLDIDLLFYDEFIVHSDALVIPHPQMQERLFVLAPLCEIAGEYVHPLIKKQVRELLFDLQKNTENQFVDELSWPE